MSSFLFAILAGFFITRLNTRFNNIKEIIAENDGFYVVLHSMCKVYGKNFTEKITNLIDGAYIEAYDYFGVKTESYYKQESKYYFKIFDLVNSVEKEQKNSFEELLACLRDIEKNRNKSNVYLIEKMRIGQWLLLGVFVTIMLFCLFYLKTPLLYSQVVTILLSTGIIMVFLIMKDLYNLRLGGEVHMYESGQEVFEYIGKLRYYPLSDLKSKAVKVPKNIKKYKIGLHKPGENFNIKIVEKEAKK